MQGTKVISKISLSNGLFEHQNVRFIKSINDITILQLCTDSIKYDLLLGAIVEYQYQQYKIIKVQIGTAYTKLTTLNTSCF